jgi:uncharacterized protein
MALTASPDVQALLLDLQLLDTTLAQLDHRAKSLPEHAALQKLATETAALTLVLAQQNGGLEDVTTELTRLESDVQVVEARIARDSARLQSSSSVKDVAALEQELAALHKRLSDLEEIELTVMEKQEEQQAAAAVTRAQLADLAAQAAVLEEARDAVLKTVLAERTNTAANRRTIEGKVGDELLALYEKQKARYGWGASHLRGGVSSASGVKLNESDLVVIRAAAPDAVILCPDSSAILVRTAESGL